MGNSHSNPTKEETRRANRLSKPLSKPLAKKLASTGSPEKIRSEVDAPELSSGLIGWQNPWVGSSLSTEKRTGRSKAREIPPTLFETDAGPSSVKRSITSPTRSREVQNAGPLSPPSNSLSMSRSVRRASYQSGVYGSSQLSFVPEQPKRANSMQTTLTRHSSVIYENTHEDATSSNTHFLVGNQRFSLTRRRSLLTRPGVATRRTTSAVRRLPSPIGEPADPIDDLSEFKVLQWPLPSRQRQSLDVASSMRPTSPPDSQYTSLGALKLGSLRVVNGSASPCPSDRIPLTQPGLGLDNVDTMGRIKSTLQIPVGPDLKKSDDVPGSPFSFEKSPTITVPPRSRSIFPGESEDEGIAIFDDSTSQSDKTGIETGLDRSTSRSLNKSDSGYSSAASVASYHHSRPRASFDSQTSGSCNADGHAKAAWISRDPSRSQHANEQIHRQCSLHEAKSKTGNYSRLHPNFDRWYDSIGPATEAPLAAPRSRRSTLCAPRYSEYLAQKVELDSAAATAVVTVREGQVFSRGPSYTDRSSASDFALSHSLVSSTSLGTGTPPSNQQLGGAHDRAKMHRSASERSLDARTKDESRGPSSQSRSRPGNRVWSQKPGVEVPPLPVIPSTEYLHDEAEGYDSSTHETVRGRPRSRSQDYRRRKLTKALSQAEIHM